MKYLHQWAIYIGVLVLAGSVLWFSNGIWGEETASPGTQVLSQAKVTVRMRTAPPQTDTTTVELPLHWDVLHRKQAGWATAELTFDNPATSDNEPQALLIPRLGNAYTVSLNGHRLASGGQLTTPNDGWTGRRPVWVHLPRTLLQPQNTVTVTIRADVLRRAGIAAVQVGPEAALEPARQALEWGYVTLPRTVSIFSLVVAAFCLLLWWQQRAVLFAFAALSELLWALRIASLWLEDIGLSWPVWFRMSVGLQCVGLLATYLLVRAIWDNRPKWEARFAWLVFALCPVALFSGPNALVAWYAVLMVSWLALVIHLVQDTPFRQVDTRLWMLLALGASWVALLRDLVAARLFPELYSVGGWTLWAASVTGFSMLVIVSLRFQQTQSALTELTTSLEQRINQREATLAQQHEELRQLERQRAKSEERARILRDMHDGAGAHLITAMRQLEGGVASQAEVMSTLRESLDQLRLSVDAMALPPGDVNALLASLRFRLERRIQDAGLALHWQVELLSPWAAATEEGMRHLQYILFEAISNVLQHAKATELTLSADMAHHDGREVIAICLQDNGVGVPEAPTGNGLRTMQERAALIGAELTIPNQPAGTVVQIRIPC